MVLVAPRGGFLPLAQCFLFITMGQISFLNWSTSCESERFFWISVIFVKFLLFFFFFVFIILVSLMAVFRETSSQGLLNGPFRNSGGAIEDVNTV